MPTFAKHRRGPLGLLAEFRVIRVEIQWGCGQVENSGSASLHGAVFRQRFLVLGLGAGFLLGC